MKKSKTSYIEYIDRDQRYLRFNDIQNSDQLLEILAEQGPEEIVLFGKPHTLTLQSFADRWTKKFRSIVRENLRQAKHHNTSNNRLWRRTDNPPLFYHLWEDIYFLNKIRIKYALPSWVHKHYPEQTKQLKHPFYDEATARVMFLQLKN